MSVCMIAFHYPQPALFDDFVTRVERVAQAFRSSGRCVSAQCWATCDRDAVVSIVTWESDQARTSSMAALQRADVDVASIVRQLRTKYHSDFNLNSSILPCRPARKPPPP